MKTYDYSEKYATCAVCGDIHGEFDFLVGKMLRMELTDTLVIVAGDCGIGFDTPGYYRRTYQRIAKTLKKLNSSLLLVRGNHDDPEFFQREMIVFPRMRTLPDYSIIRFKDRTILCVGGAISIDRLYRIDQMRILADSGRAPRKLYWENETPQFDEREMNAIKEAGLRIDTVVTHTAPSFCYPTTKRGIEMWMAYDPNLEKDIDEERATMDRLHNRLLSDGHPLTQWYYGHYHCTSNDRIDGVGFHLLDIGQINEIPVYR